MKIYIRILLFVMFLLCVVQQENVEGQTVEFYKCNLNTMEQVASSARRRGRLTSDEYSCMSGSDVKMRSDAECAMVPLAVEPDVDESVNPQTPMLNVFVKRFRATPGKNAPKVLWMIMGGIGGTTLFFETSVVSSLIELTKGQFDLYMMDHRGVGRSTRAACDGSQAESPGSVGGQKITDSEWPKCYDSFRKEWANGMHKHLNSKSGGIDVAKLITKINVPLDQKVFIYGTSYGTVQVTRFMRHLELTGSNLVSGVILDSVLSTKGSFGNGITSFDRFDAGYDFVAKQILQICGNVKRARGDDTCLKHLGKDVVNPNFLNEFYENLYSKSSTCPEFTKIFTSTQTKLMFGELISSRGTRPLFPALIYRIKRCDSKKDVPLFKLAFENYFPQSTEVRPVQMLTLSELTQFNIALSELWDYSTTQEILDQRLKSNTAIPKDSGIEFKVSQLTKWQPYNLDPLYYNHTFKTSVPVMLLNGDLDPDTPLYDAKTQSSNIEGNTKGGLIVIDFATHVSLMSSPQTGSSYPCGLELLANFITMDEPNVNTLDKSCLSKLEFTFKGNPKENMEILGIEDLYDGSLYPESDEFKIETTTFVVLVSVLSIIVIVLLIAHVGTTICMFKRKKTLNHKENFKQLRESHKY